MPKEIFYNSPYFVHPDTPEVLYIFKDGYLWIKGIKTILYREFFLVLFKEIEEDKEVVITELVRTSIGFASWFAPSSDHQYPDQNLSYNDNEFANIEYSEYLEIQKAHYPLPNTQDSQYFNLSVEVSFDRLVYNHNLSILQRELVRDTLIALSKKRISQAEEKKVAFTDGKDNLTH